MNKTDANTGDSNTSRIPANTPNKAATPKTQADFYGHAWKVIFNKLSKDEQAYLTVNLNKPYKVIRGVPQPDSTVSRFIENVAAVGEEMFEKASKAPKATK